MDRNDDISTNRSDRFKEGTVSDATRITSRTRRDFIARALERSAGVYLGMSVIDAFAAPSTGRGRMPVTAVSRSPRFGT